MNNTFSCNFPAIREHAYWDHVMWYMLQYKISITVCMFMDDKESWEIGVIQAMQSKAKVH